MRDETCAIVERVRALGVRCGFEVRLEHTATWPWAEPGESANRHDAVWGVPLAASTCEALERATGALVEPWLPVVGFEIEGTTPNTKVMAMDAAGLAASGVPLGAVVVVDRRPGDCLPGTQRGRAGGERGIYGRCARILRTMGSSLGVLRIFPLDVAHLDAIEARLRARTEPLATNSPPGGRRPTRGSGGERDLVAGLRESVVRTGEGAGFLVREDWTPDEVVGAEAAFWRMRPENGWGLRDSPHEQEPRRRGAFTRSKIDVTWLLPLPSGLQGLLEHVVAVNPDVELLHGIHPAAWRYLPLVGFELEGGAGKHASGGMLSLHAWCRLGVTVAYGNDDADTLRRQLVRLKRRFGLPGVRVLEARSWTS